VRGSGNREDIDTENENTKPVQQQVIAAIKTETKETIPFKKPVMPLPEHLKITSIKDTLEKNKPATLSENIKTEEVATAEKIETAAQETISETETTPLNTETESAEQDVVFSSLQDCWMDCIKETSTSNTVIAVGLLSRQTPVENEDNTIEIEVPNEVAKQEVKEIIPVLTQQLTKKTGISYSFDIKIVRTVQEKQVDKTNPDEKFKHICKENPKLMDFKQRLNLSIS
jgi:hypothetical protein